MTDEDKRLRQVHEELENWGRFAANVDEAAAINEDYIYYAIASEIERSRETGEVPAEDRATVKRRIMGRAVDYRWRVMQYAMSRFETIARELGRAADGATERFADYLWHGAPSPNLGAGDLVVQTIANALNMNINVMREGGELMTFRSAGLAANVQGIPEITMEFSPPAQSASDTGDSNANDATGDSARRQSQ